jgi:hypothetical protein
VKLVRRSLSTGLPTTSYDNLDSYTLVEHGGIQGTDWAATTCRLPLNLGKGQCNHLSLHTQAPRLHLPYSFVQISIGKRLSVKSSMYLCVMTYKIIFSKYMWNWLIVNSYMIKFANFSSFCNLIGGWI